MEHTRKERAAIKLVATGISNIADVKQGGAHRFDELVRRDRSQANEIHTARMVCARSFWSGFDNPSKPIEAIAGIRESAQLACLLGASVAWYWKQEPGEKHSRQRHVDVARQWMEEAEKAQAAAMKRFLVDRGLSCSDA